MQRPIRTLIIDDSSFNRHAIAKLLESIPGVIVSGMAADGNDGLKQVLALKPDLITLDLEMPVMDGFTFLRMLMQANPTPVIVISSKPKDSNVFKAMELGAVDFIQKPVQSQSSAIFDIRNELAAKIAMLSHLKMDRVVKGISVHHQPADTDTARGSRPFFDAVSAQVERTYEVIAIGSSTGGPSALNSVLTRLPGDFPAAVVISQHMPPGFTKAFSERLDRACKIRVKEAENGDELCCGNAFIAPGGFHLTFKRSGKGVIANLIEKNERDNYVPSVDIMFSSAAEIWRSKAMAVVLTGMGHDGAAGVIKIKEMGGYAMAESEETAVVFGMPDAAIATGKVDEVAPLHSIGMSIARKCRKKP